MQNPLFFQPTFGTLFDALPNKVPTKPIAAELPADDPTSDIDQSAEQL
jgi:hypothetical protein